MTESKRFYVGNLFSDIGEADLRSLFERFGNVANVEIKMKRDIDGNVTATFAFVTMDGLAEGDVANVIKQCNHLKWKRQIIRVQLAQESFMQRLQKERDQLTKFQRQTTSFNMGNANDYDPMKLVKGQLEEKPKPQQPARKRYYSSSDEEDSSITPRSELKGQSQKFMSQLENFNSDFWNDCETSVKAGSKLSSGDTHSKKQRRSQRTELSDRKSKVAKLSEDEPINGERDDERQNRKLLDKSEDSDSDQEKLKSSKKSTDSIEGREETEQDLEAERLKNLQILNSVVGKPNDDGKKRKNLFKDTSRLRFDPTNKDHDQFIIKEKTEKSRDESSDVNESPVEKPVETKVKRANSKVDESYWISGSLSTAFGHAKSSGFNFGLQSDHQPKVNGFSLLSKYGKAEEEAEAQTKSKLLPFVDKNPFKYESSDTEDEAETRKKITLPSVDPINIFAQKLKEKASGTKSTSSSFFFRVEDPRFEEGRVFLTETEAIDELRTKHEENRPVLAQIMKTKLKRIAKSRQKMLFDAKNPKKSRRGGFMKKKFKLSKNGRKF